MHRLGWAVAAGAALLAAVLAMDARETEAGAQARTMACTRAAQAAGRKPLAASDYVIGWHPDRLLQAAGALAVAVHFLLLAEGLRRR